MSEVSKSRTGLPVEYFDDGVLYRRDWTLGVTIAYAKAVDLFAEKGDKRIAIQVRVISKKSNVGGSIILVNTRPEYLYIFVNLHADKMSASDYFICTSEEV